MGSDSNLADLPFVELTGNPFRQPVIITPSVGSETVAVVDDEIIDRLINGSDGLIRSNGKTGARHTSVHDSPHGGKAARITLHNGREVEVDLGQPLYQGVAAGSAVNIAFALGQLSRSQLSATTAIGILGALGSGSGGTALIDSLEAMGFNHRAMLPRRLPTQGDGQGGTASSLWLITPGGRTISFSYKPPYFVPTEILRHIRERLTAHTVVCTGFMPYEMDLIQTILTAHNAAEFRVVAPHQGCYGARVNRVRCLDLTRGTTLFHANGDELALLLDEEPNWHLQGDQEVMTLLARVESDLVCITLSELGSVTYNRANRQLVRQQAHEVSYIRNPIGAGDVHLAALIYYLWIRNRTISLRAALDMAAWVAARKLEAEGEDGRVLRPAEGIPDSAARKDVVHAAEALAAREEAEA